MKRSKISLVCSVLGGFLVFSSSCGFVALPLENVANTSRTDAQASDGKGGWLDLGSNDLSVLPAGETRYAGVPFQVLPSGNETAKNCLVLGRKGPEKAMLRLAEPISEPYLHLLHACADAPAPETHRAIGRVVLRFADGTSSVRTVCVGKSVGDWTNGRSFSNAARVWTAYNNNTQVSLFLASFALDARKKIAEVSFEADGTCPWMIIAATATDKADVSQVRSAVEPSGTYRSPEVPAKPLERTDAGLKPKNVILVIGDGMGRGAAELASYYKHARADALYFQQLPVVGLCSTFSANDPVTDSAAAATAFATGTKTSNGVLGVRVDEKHTRTNAVPLVSVAARARAKGLGVAILTSDPLYGATSAAYFAHSVNRGDAALVCAQAAESGFDVLVGSASTEKWCRPKSQGGERRDGRDLVQELSRKGYAFVRTPEEITAAPKGAKILGALRSFKDGRQEESIGEAMKAVFGRMAVRTEGFFMMAECCDTDHACHGNDSSHTVKTVSMVEFMAKAAVDFAQTRGDTLVIVTADHDTGHPMVVRGAGPDGRLFVQWTTTAHSAFPVPVHAYGPGAELFEGRIDNTDIAKNIVQLMDLPEITSVRDQGESTGVAR